MNKLLLNISALVLLLMSTQMHAQSTGAYVGFGLGASTLDEMSDTSKTDDLGFAGRVLAGYQFNEYWGVEGSYARLHTQNYFLNDYSWINFDYKLAALGVVGKLYLPLNERFNLNVSLGVAELFSDIDAASIYDETTHLTESSEAFVAAIGAGVGFNLTAHLKTTFDLMVYGQREGDESHLTVPGATLLAAGLVYQF